MVVVLGPTGRNFGAGMTNGLAYVYDPDGGVRRARSTTSRSCSNAASTARTPAELRELIERHVKLTDSAHAKRLLEDWDDTLAAIWKVIPRATLALLAAAAEEEVEDGGRGGLASAAVGRGDPRLKPGAKPTKSLRD